jgi:hypothetical protein
MSIRKSNYRFISLIACAIIFQGCILIQTTEHRINLKPDGSGEAVLRLIDIRTDEMSDSLAEQDCRIMLTSFDRKGIEDFEANGRTVISKQLFVQADTLNAEIGYTFEAITAIEGLRVTKDELYLIVKADKTITKTNGRIEPWQKGAQRIIWERGAERLIFRISEQRLPPSRSLASIYERLQHN